MTSTPSATRPFRLADLGTLVVMPWSGEAADGADMPYLLAYSLGDAADGPEASAAAIERLLTDNGLPVGGDLVDGTERPSLPVGLLVEAGQAVLTMAPSRPSACPRPSGWPPSRAAVTPTSSSPPAPGPRPPPAGPSPPRRWPRSCGADETLKAAAHVVLPARSLRGW